MKLGSALGLLLCLSSVGGAEAKLGRGRRVPTPGTEPPSRAGNLLNKSRHRCAWETYGADEITLRVRCTHEGGSYQCRYAGRPTLCSSYSDAPGLYWAQVVRRLRRRSHACDGSKVLKVQACKLAPARSHMRQSARSRSESPTEEPGQELRGSGRKGGRTPAREKRPPEEERHTSVELSATEPEETYCAEGWSSVCSFFLKFFDG
ncbi:fibroblast growth factor-binding protein 2 [Scleropages formosus]|uniref:fibroblast growth factor-binding protein 2 n=1 Tax=Scleropages formosus TaxID=113540 RepID=UPI0006347E3D|nr:fibroblast growth factor-binding protein 3 [Scleropages formosus]